MLFMVQAESTYALQQAQTITLKGHVIHGSGRINTGECTCGDGLVHFGETKRKFEILSGESILYQDPKELLRFQNTSEIIVDIPSVGHFLYASCKIYSS